MRQTQLRKERTVRKMQVLPVEKLEEYLSGNLNLENNPMEDFGVSYQRVLASVRLYEEAGEKADTLPYHVGTYRFSDHCGLYIITAAESLKEKMLMEELLEALSYTGIGGKRSEGLGKFEFCFEKRQKNSWSCCRKSQEIRICFFLSHCRRIRSLIMLCKMLYIRWKSVQDLWHRKLMQKNSGKNGIRNVSLSGFLLQEYV